MLKLNYTDYGLHLEQVDASLDTLATQRVMLAVYTGQSLHIAPGRAAFLLPATMPGLVGLRTVLRRSMAVLTGVNGVAIATVDSEFVEISLRGTWIAQDAVADTGTFITALTPESESLIYRLWQSTQVQTPLTA